MFTFVHAKSRRRRGTVGGGGKFTFFSAEREEKKNVFSVRMIQIHSIALALQKHLILFILDLLLRTCVYFLARTTHGKVKSAIPKCEKCLFWNFTVGGERKPMKNVSVACFLFPFGFGASGGARRTFDARSN